MMTPQRFFWIVATLAAYAFVAVAAWELGKSHAESERAELSPCRYLGSRIEGSIVQQKIHRYKCADFEVESRFGPND